MTTIVFDKYDFRFRTADGAKQIYDPVRKRYIELTPEEWVRQHCLHYLIDLGYSPALMAVERAIQVNNQTKRFDIVVYSQDTQPLILVECKAETEPLTQQVLMQIASYNLSVRAAYFWLTNGVANYFVRLQDGKVMNEIPKAATLYGK